VANGAMKLVTRLGYPVLSLGLKPDTPRLTVGMWGSRSTGKTTSLALLPGAAESNLWTMQPIDEATSDFLASSRRALLDDGRFPGPAATVEPRPLSFLVAKRRTYVEKITGRRRTFSVSFLDAPGEWCERPIPARRSAPDSPIEYLAACDAIFFFLDAARMRTDGSDYAADLVLLLDALRRRLDLPKGGLLPHRISFIVPKVDEDDLWPQRDRAREYVMELLGMVPSQDIVERFKKSNCRFFACSSVGRLDGRSNCERQCGESWVVDRGQIQPYHLFDPLEWILTHPD
jgi:hypothetical protein